jgi:hypothetical protein
MSHDTPTGWVKPARSLVTAAGRAIGDYRMIRDGDRILLGLSGGKDSLALLHTLHHLQQKAPVKFELLACTVDPQSDQYDPRRSSPTWPISACPTFSNRSRSWSRRRKHSPRIPIPTAPIVPGCGAAFCIASRASNTATSSRWPTISTTWPKR